MENPMNLAHTVHHAPPVIAISPQHRLAPQVAIAASRAGALGLLDLGLRTDSGAMLAAVAELVRSAGATATWGLRFDLVCRHPGALARPDRLA
jgi:hypothetical protein